MAKIVNQVRGDKQTYTLHHIKRDPATLKFLTEDGKPIPGDKIKEVRLHEEHADELNGAWESLGKVCVLKGVDAAEDDPFAEIKAMKKADLVAQLEAYGQDTEGKVDELKARLIDFLKAGE